MSFKEVSQLRKNGQLDEALQMANADLETDQSPWSYRALFWVLHDKCKQCISNNQMDEATDLANQMKELLPSMENEQDSLAEKQLDYLERQLSPLNDTLHQADQDSRDDHKVAQAFASIKTIIEDDATELDAYQQTTVGWIIYRYAKHELARKATYNVKLALSQYFKLSVEKPSLLHSSILRIAVDLETEFKNDFKFTTFFNMWGFDNLTEEDWKRFKTDDGITIPSLSEKAIGRYCKELVDDHITSVPDEFVQLIETARKRLNHDGKIELNYARVLEAQGDKHKAIQVYRAVTQKIPQAYVWQEMADVIDDREIKQAILCKVITMQRDEQFLGDTRLLLAQHLIEDGNFAAAKLELDTYRQGRRAKGWAVKDPYHELAGRIPADTQASENNRDLYDRKLEILIDYIYPDAKTAVMLYNGKTVKNKNGKQRAKLIAYDGTHFLIAPNKLPRHPSQQQYYFYTVKYAETNRGLEPLKITPVDTQEGLQHFDIISGEVRIKTKADGKRFGFIGDCYVHQSLLGNIADGQQLQVVATKNKDGRLNAVAIL